jgi:hypothetical protein
MKVYEAMNALSKMPAGAVLNINVTSDNDSLIVEVDDITQETDDGVTSVYVGASVNEFPQ